jgi:hypothetical protein
MIVNLFILSFREDYQMRHFYFITLFALISVLTIYSFAQEDPFAGNYELLNSQEIVFSGNSGGYFTQQVFDYLNFPAKGDSLVGGPFTIPVDDSLENSGNSHWSDMDAGNFFGDGTEETVTAWKDPRNGTVSLLVSHIDPFSRQWHSAFYAQSDSGLLGAEWPLDKFGDVRVVTGDFDNDGMDEFVLAYWGSALNTLQMFLYDADSTTNFQVKATQNDQSMYNKFLTVEAYHYPWFDLHAADLNRDGRDEIILTGVEPSGIGWDVFLQIYNYDENLSAFVKQGRKIIYQSTTDSDFPVPYPIRIALGAGHFTNRKFMDCVVGIWAVDSSNAFEYDVDQNLVVVQVDSSLQEINYKRNFSKYLEEPESSMFGLASGDLNGHGYDYLFLQQRQHILIFRVQEDLTLKQLYDHNEHWHYYGFSESSRHNVVIADIDTSISDSNGLPEIILFEYIYFNYYPYNKMRLSIFEAELDSSGAVLALNLKGMKDNFEDDGFYPQLMIAANLDMDDIHLEAPRRFQKTDIVQPIVVLNAPPIHYDILNGTPYDLCYAYNENECDFYSTYQKISENSIEVSTEVMKSWTTSQTLSGSFSAFNVSIGASLSKKYGKNFSKVTGSSHTVTIQVAADAIVDDRIYATIVDYNLWEYPAFAGKTPIGHILVIEPVAVRNQWFPSKSSVATTYIPNHEVGNILSYKEYPELFNNDEVASLIKGSYSQSFTLDGNSSYDWALTFNDFSSSGTSTSNTVTREIGGSVGIFGISAGVSDSYSKSSTRTHQISVTENLSLQVHLDKIDQTIGEDYYTVTPYAYWAKNGALVVDYAAKPELSEPGYPLTWWQTNYDVDPDPAFILPWRYDEEKGLSPTLDKEYQTKEILFTPAEPTPGEVVTISARIQNYSLLATAAPVKVRFYVGNPDSGGTVITGTGGEPEVSTEDIIQPRSSTWVYMDWKIPEDLEQFPRIFAVIDPDNEMSEIHEDNNMGFSVLGKYSIPTDLESPDEELPVRFELKQNYPNPFNPVTTISYQLAIKSDVNLSIYNILGQKVATLVSENQQPGEYSIRWDASQLSSGFYFYRIVAGDFVSAKKMLLLK